MERTVEPVGTVEIGAGDLLGRDGARVQLGEQLDGGGAGGVNHFFQSNE